MLGVGAVGALLGVSSMFKSAVYYGKHLNLTTQSNLETKPSSSTRSEASATPSTAKATN